MPDQVFQDQTPVFKKQSNEKKQENKEKQRAFSENSKIRKVRR